MIHLKNFYLFITFLPIATIAMVYLHRLYPKIYSRNLKFMHTLISTIACKVNPRRSRMRILTLSIKVAIAILLSLALAEPYVVTHQHVYLESKEVSEMHFNVKPPLIIILDTSGSMFGEKIEIAKNVLISFLSRLSISLDVGFIDFAGNVKQAIPPTDDREVVVQAINKAVAEGGTMYSYPLRVAMNWLKPYKELNISASIVFVSDGLPADRQEYRSLLEEFKNLGIPIYTVFIGYESEGVNEMKYIADVTGGEAFVAETVEKLSDVLRKALEEASQAIQKVEVEAKIVKTVEIEQPITHVLLLATLILYIVYRVIVYKLSSLTF